MFRAFHLDLSQVRHGAVENIAEDDEGEALRPSALSRVAADDGGWIDGLPLAWHTKGNQSHSNA